MKKAVSSVIAFLKKKKEDFSLSSNSKVTSSDEAVDQRQANHGEKFRVIRMCKRCVLVYEKKSREEYVLGALLQQRDNAEELNETPIHSLEKKWITTPPPAQIREDGFERTNANCNRTSAYAMSIFEHLLLWDFSSHEPEYLGFHRPAFLWLRICDKKKDTPLIYEDKECSLINLRLDLVFSLMDIRLPVCRLAARVNMEVWVFWQTLSNSTITLDVETELIHGYLQDLFQVAFLHVPFTSKERYAKLEAIFQAVDQILEIGAHMIMASGDSPESESSVKEVIIETATVVTSTAAESTATVGIETAAMALGQAAAGVAISVLVDIALTAGSVTRAKLQRDKGLISHSQFKSEVKRKLCDSGCQFIGGTTGTIVGQVLIPVPVVGAIVGGFCGSLIGVGVSKGIMKTTELIAKAHNSRTKAITEK